MKRQGKLLILVFAILLAAMLLISTSGLEIFIFASSDEYESYAMSAKYLEAISVMKGYDDGELHLEEPIRRYQAALLFGRVVTGVVDDSLWGEGPSTVFTDVPQYGNVMDMIHSLGIIRGYDADTFGYNDGIRYQDMCAMWVRALGYETEKMVETYPMSYVLKVEDLGFSLENIKPADYLNRGQVAQMLYDALVTEISKTGDDKLDLIIEILLASQGEENINETKDTYLERNFDVSSQMHFQIVATEHYKMGGYSYTEKDYFAAVQLKQNDANTAWEIVGDPWTFPIEGDATNGVTEGDLVGKFLTLVFDHKEPTATLLEDEVCNIVHAEMASADIYQNIGELSYVHFTDNDKYDTLILGQETVKFDGKLDPEVRVYNGNQASVFDTVELSDTDNAKALADMMNADTYFHVESYDFDGDGEYDWIVYVPYTFGQFVTRTYRNQTYTMVGQYSSTPKYDVSNTTEKTDNNKTHFVERFLGTNEEAGSTNSYTPSNTNLSISEYASRYSKEATVTGKEIQSGEFMLYNYNILTGELYVAENLGAFQIGAMTGYRTSAETYVIDGVVRSVGLPGAMTGETGLLTQEIGFEVSKDLAERVVVNFKKGNSNIKYLEYDGKVIYFEAYGASDIVVGSDYVIVDIEETYNLHEKEVGTEEAWDIPFDSVAAIVKVLDPLTGELNDIKVEKLIVNEGTDGSSADVTYNFNDVDLKYIFGTWVEKNGYNLFKDNGAIYATEDEDKDGLLELYAYGSAEFKIVGAPIKQANGTNADIAFYYNVSNVFVQDNDAGILVDRIVTTKDTISVVIGQDGYIVVKGQIGNDTESTPNGLWLSTAALVLEANESQLIVFDPVGYTKIQGSRDDEKTSMFNDNALSIWNTGRMSSASGISYYMMLHNSSYNGSEILLDAQGSIIKNEDGKNLYSHSYDDLYNLVTGATESLNIITTDGNPPAVEVINSVNGVIRVDADNYEATITTFGEVFVENGDYQYGGFSWLAAKDKISFATQAKDKDGNGVLSADEKAKSASFNADSNFIYKTLNSLNVTFIDLDAGAAVDPDEHCFKDAYVFYREGDWEKRSFTSVELIDREPGVDYAEGALPIKRHEFEGNKFSSVISNGKITNLTQGKLGLIGNSYFFRWNGWSDYLIPPVDADGETVWSYAGSLRVKVTYYAYIDYDEDALAVDAVVVRVGEIVGEISDADAIPTLGPVPDSDDMSNNMTEQ